MGKISIQEIAAKLIAQNGLSKKEATLFVNMMFETVREALERDKSVKVKGLGTFKIIDVDSRESVNVNTGERVLIEGHNKITFTPDVLMKELVNKPFSQFETIVLNDGVDFKDKEDSKADTSEAEDGESEMDDVPLVDFASEEVADEDIPEWVIEPFVVPVAEKPAEPGEPVNINAPIDLGTPKEPEIPEVPETPAQPETPVEPEIPTEPDIPAEPEVPVEPEASVESEIPTEPEALYTEDAEDEELSEYDEEEQPSDKSWLWWLLACVLALGIGYLLGSHFPYQGLTGTQEPVAPKVEKTVPAKPAQPVAQPTQSAAPSDQPAAEPEKEKQREDEAVQAPEPPQASAPAPQAEVKLDKYEAMDARVKNGAYRIVGTDFEEIVREGDNLQRICKRTIGPGMECYIEVYNGITATTELKKGMKIKIPKLEWKKKKKAQK